MSPRALPVHTRLRATTRSQPAFARRPRPAGSTAAVSAPGEPGGPDPKRHAERWRCGYCTSSTRHRRKHGGGPDHPARRWHRTGWRFRRVRPRDYPGRCLVSVSGKSEPFGKSRVGRSCSSVSRPSTRRRRASASSATDPLAVRRGPTRQAPWIAPPGYFSMVRWWCLGSAGDKSGVRSAGVSSSA
jgi:hypothetical protein